MPYALQLYFDPVTDATVRNLWRQLAQTGVAPHLHASANRPRRTLAVSGDLDLAEAERELGRFVAALAPFPLIFSHWWRHQEPGL